MVTIGNIGIGLLILIILWIITLIIFVVGIKLQSNLAWIVLGAAILFTIILLCIPTEERFVKKSIRKVEKDYSILYKSGILVFLIFSFLFGLFIVFIFHCIEPVRPKLFKSFLEYS